jgi:hypothetical protein
MMIGYLWKGMHYVGETVHVVNDDVNRINKIITLCGDVTTARTQWFCFPQENSEHTVTCKKCLSKLLLEDYNT